MADGRVADKDALKKSNLKELRELLGRMNKQLEAALPRFITPERMIRVATTTVQKVPKLLEAAPVTVVGAIMQAAGLGLEPDNVTGSAYLVPFWNSRMRRLECTLIPGYRGLMALARRSKEIAAFDAHVVKAGDAFDYEYGSRQFLRHKPAPFTIEMKDGKAIPSKTGEPDTIAAYMIAFYGTQKTHDNFPLSQFSVMHRPELERIKDHTKSRDKQNQITGPWLEHEDAMFVKSAIRKGAKLLPFSIELMTAVSLDERAIAGKSQNLGALVADDLGIGFSADDDAETDAGTNDTGENEATVDAALVTKLDTEFGRLGYREAQRTAKMQEFKGRLPELAQWLEAQPGPSVKSAGEGKTESAAAAAETTSDTKKPIPGKFRI